LAAKVEAQASWQLNAGAITYRVSDLNGWGHGIDVTARRTTPRLAFEFGATALLSSTGFYDFGGVSATIGVGRVWDFLRASLSLSGGAAALAGGDSDGTYRYAGGLYAAAEGTWWWRPRVGLYTRVVGRLWQDIDTAPSAAAGLSLRL
jgi:hypothetical protein